MQTGVLTDIPDMAESPNKKHKKHKKHKHKKHRTDPERDDEDTEAGQDHSGLGDDFEEDIDVMSSPPSSIKLKIKLGGETVGTTSIKSSVDDTTNGEPDNKGKVKGDDVFMTKKAGDDTSDEEREWLNALEAGTLDDSGAIKKCKDPTLMTARQRARVSGTPDEPMMQLPSGYKTNELTDEQLERRQQRAKKRREAAAEKQEKDKKQTVDRLLKKQQTKLRGKSKGLKHTQAPSFRYISNQQMTSISTPYGYSFPCPPQAPKSPPAPVLCGVSGCPNKKKYSCSKTGISLCSLECYKTNLLNQQSTEVTV